MPMVPFEPADLTFVVMAKRPAPGLVNTRLVRPDFMDASRAAALAWDMLGCTLHRLSARGQVILAVSPDGSGPELARVLGTPDPPVVDQGHGDLGDRLDRVWRRIGPERPLAFFGMDSPDFPADAVLGIGAALQASEVAIGPTMDGGYWTLAARRHEPRLTARIDWGSGSVYDQTCARAARSGLNIARLPRWHDVDRPDDVWALRRRLREGPTESDDALRTLAARLDELLDGISEP